MVVNDQNYWEKRFSDDWESLAGPKQSRFFSMLSLANLPRWIFQAARTSGLTMADWGCAQGDGTELIASAVDAGLVTGIDFSETAIQQARNRYPGLRFEAEDWLSEQGGNTYDIVFSSNTLEHFHDPLRVLERIALRARKAVLLALPYRELERHPEHFFTFLPHNIPLVLANGFRLVWSQPVDCRSLPNTSWPGEQIFLAYVNPEWADARLRLTLCDTRIQAGTDAETAAALAKLERQLVDARTASAATDLGMADLKSALEATNDELLRARSALAAGQDNMGELKSALLAKERELIDAKAAVLTRDREVLAARTALDQKCADIDAVKAQLQAAGHEVDALRTELQGARREVQQLRADVQHWSAEAHQKAEQLDALEHSARNKTAESGEWNAVKQELLQRNERLTAELESRAQELGRISSWASQIATRPVRYAIKRTSYLFAKELYGRLPLSIGQKHKLKGLAFDVLRRRRTSQGGATTGGSVPAVRADLKVQWADAPEERDVFVFAVIDWHFRIQRPQHLARSLAHQGRRVFYISNAFVDDATPGYALERLDPALDLYQVKLHVRGAPPIYFAPPAAEVIAMLQASMAKLIADFAALSSISLLQHSFWFPLAKTLPNSLRVYDCMDHHEGFGNVAPEVIRAEEAMLRTSDLVLVTSNWLHDFASRYNQHLAMVRNAGEYAFFATRPQQVYADPHGRRVIGYYGAIAEWFDLALVRRIAQTYPDCLVLLVGNDTVHAARELSDLPNVQFTGEVRYRELPYYLYAFDVCLLPFQVSSLTLATNPVKVYEYLAAGKPVVCVDLPEIAQFGELVWKAADAAAFVRDVGVALAQAQTPDVEAPRRSFAAQQTWEHRGEQIREALRQLVLPKISVVVLTFNNLDLTKKCLASVLGESDYPNLELIVVDNASTDASPEYLTDFAKDHPGVRVILNDANLGFAAGNNVGLSAATGDYLVILNNDTVVTRGWAMTMMRHLQENPDIGLVGPVTNNIGNGARVEMKYRDPADMPPEAFALTLSHMGARFSLRTAAFFCVMFPRAVYEACGPICEDYGRGFFEDDDYCRRVEQKGFKVACIEDVFVHHHLSASFNKLPSPERQALFDANKVKYESKWGRWEPHTYERELSWRVPIAPTLVEAPATPSGKAVHRDAADT